MYLGPIAPMKDRPKWTDDPDRQYDEWLATPEWDTRTLQELVADEGKPAPPPMTEIREGWPWQDWRVWIVKPKVLAVICGANLLSAWFTDSVYLFGLNAAAALGTGTCLAVALTTGQDRPHTGIIEPPEPWPRPGGHD